MTFVTYKYIANKHDYKETEYSWPDSGINKVLALSRMAASLLRMDFISSMFSPNR